MQNVPEPFPVSPKKSLKLLAREVKPEFIHIPTCIPLTMLFFTVRLAWPEMPSAPAFELAPTIVLL